jgi:hypothetical protein
LPPLQTFRAHLLHPSLLSTSLFFLEFQRTIIGSRRNPVQCGINLTI